MLVYDELGREALERICVAKPNECVHVCGTDICNTYVRLFGIHVVVVLNK